jgi:uncharacterized DUF497 family protein
VVGFDWDEGNILKPGKHAVSNAEAEQVFVNEPLVVMEDAAHSRGESRWHALGRTNDGRRLHITFTLRATGTKVRIISARPMHRKEMTVYGKAPQAHS